MGKKRVFILNSMGGSASLGRFEFLLNFNPYIEKKFEVSGCGVFSLIDKPYRNELQKVLLQRCQEFYPDIIIVHSGWGFQMYPWEILSALGALKLEFPNFCIGLERETTTIERIRDRSSNIEKKDELINKILSNEIFDHTSEIQELIEQILHFSWN